MKQLYPLKFEPILKEKIWGGTKLSTPDSKLENIGESFVVSGLTNDTSVVLEGSLKGSDLTSLIKRYKEDLVGKRVFSEFGSNFPLLIKFIDANDDLSIQVHPDNELAAIKHNALGKTEMWYVMDSETDSGLFCGFNKVTSKEEFESLHRSNRLMDLLRFNPTSAGDAFFIPAGKVHSIGKGNVIAEIQQSSDITYRIYDFNRKDDKGNTRELHHALAVDALNFSDNQSGKVPYERKENGVANIVQCEYFTTSLLQLNDEAEMDYTPIDSFVILVNVGEACEIESQGYNVSLGQMESILIPACFDKVKIKTNSTVKLLEVYV